ncbi:MAG: PA0069 family radical SAM protein [Burkholderiaceae bacterium]
MSSYPVQFFKGRGAVSNPQHRFEKDARAPVRDGWEYEGAEFGYDDDGQPLDAAGHAPATQITHEHVKSIISRNDSPDIYFAQSINPYRGCEHGCVYCYARPTHSYLGMSPGLDFETKIIAKINAADVLRHELQARSYKPSLILVGSATDPYQPVERDLKLTRGVLQLLAQSRHATGVITKHSLIERDIDLLAELASQQLVSTYITITTLDHSLSRILEPRAASPARRLRTIEALAKAGVPVGVSVAPVIPFITEPEMEKIMDAAVAAGATSAFYTVLRLPWEVKDLFIDWLSTHFPDRKARVLSRLKDMRGLSAQDAPRLNDPNFFSRMKGEGLWADMIGQRFNKHAAKHGLNRVRYHVDAGKFDAALLSGQQSLW